MKKNTMNKVVGKQIYVYYTPRESLITQELRLMFRDESEAKAIFNLGPYYHKDGLLKVARRLNGDDKGTSLEAELKRYRATQQATKIVKEFDLTGALDYQGSPPIRKEVL